MSLMPVCSLEEISPEEILEEFKKIVSVYSAYKVQKKTFVFPSCGPEEEEAGMNRHLLENVLPIAKTVPYFERVQCEPREVRFCDLEEGVYGRRNFYTIQLNKLYRDDLIMASILTHEACHALGAIFWDEALATILGWEVDARMVLAGYERHRTSLYICLRNAIFHVSYLKAKSVGLVDKWTDMIKEFYGGEITEETISKNIGHFEKGEKEDLFGGRSSDYSVPPYLAIKGAIKVNSTHISEEYELFGETKRENIEIPSLLRIWSELVVRQ